MKNPFLQLSPEQRICKIARLDFEEFVSESKGKEIEKDSWLAGKIIASFEYLRERSQELRLSAETMESYGLDFKAFRKLYFSVAR